MTVRLIIKERLSIERGNEEVVREPGGRDLPSRVAHPLLQLARTHAEMKSRVLATLFAPYARSLNGRIRRLLIYSARQKAVLLHSDLYKTIASFSRSLQGRITRLLIYSARQKVVTASLLLILIPTAVIGTISGLALGLIKARTTATSSLTTVKQSVPLNVSVPPKTIAPAPSIASPANSSDNIRSHVTANDRAVRANARPAALHLNLEEPSKNKDTNSLTPNSPHSDEIRTLSTPLEVKVVEEKPAPDPPHRAIAVVVQIEEGRVKEAYIQNPEVGLKAFEATALRRARDRRYSKETSRKETVIVHISSKPSP